MSALREIKVLQSLNHTNCARLREVVYHGSRGTKDVELSELSASDHGNFGMVRDRPAIPPNKKGLGLNKNQGKSMVEGERVGWVGGRETPSSWEQCCDKPNPPLGAW